MIKRIASLLPNHLKIVKVSEESSAVFLFDFSKTGRVMKNDVVDRLKLIFWVTVIVFVSADTVVTIKGCGFLSSAALISLFVFINAIAYAVAARKNKIFIQITEE